MGPPTIHQLPTLTLQPTRASACPFTLYTGFIAGHICVPAGGGEDSLVTLSPALSVASRGARNICFESSPVATAVWSSASSSMQHFALQGQVDLFATQILTSLRGDSRPQLAYRIEDLLARVPGAVARSPA